MFDNICSLPLSSDLLSQAIHPTLPIFSVGLASGHVQLYRLPSSHFHLPEGHLNHAATEAAHSTRETAPTLPHSRFWSQASPLTQPSSTKETAPSSTGSGTIDTVWRTRRHKGSCRTLAFSTDGSTLFSAGTDGLIKAASASTGKVVDKVLVPRIRNTPIRDTATVLLPLSPQSLALGTDSGAVHIYALHPISPDPVTTGDTDSSREGSPLLAPYSRPTQTYHPHKGRDASAATDPISSLTPLPPTSASTSRFCRAFASTAGNTLAVCDLYKGVMSCSIVQGEELGVSVCYANLQPSGGTQIKNLSRSPSTKDIILAGQSNGVASVWVRGKWEDRSASFTVHKAVGMADRALWEDDEGIESFAVSPLHWQWSHNDHSRSALVNGAFAKGDSDDRIVAAGLANGHVKFLRLENIGSESARTQKLTGRVFSQVAHDERGIESVITVGFDVEGRLISGGGDFVKIWHAKEWNTGYVVGTRDHHENGNRQEEDKEKVGSVEEDDSNELILNGGTSSLPKRARKKVREYSGDCDGDEDEASPTVDNKKRRRGGKGGGESAGHHGIFAFQDLD